MLTLSDMLFRLGVALFLGVIIGIERELAHKEAGVRTDLMVSAGASIFAMIGVMLPYVVEVGNLSDVIARNSGFFAVIANVVVGIGFLGAGIIVKQGTHVRSLTTAATIWFVASIGVLCGIGLISFAVIATIGVTLLLFILRSFNILGPFEGKGGK